MACYSCYMLVYSCVQCVSLDSPRFRIYPEIKATEVKFSALKPLQNNQTKLGEYKRNTLYT